MEDGRCLLDVIGDPKLLNEFLEDGSDVVTAITEDSQVNESAFKWADELLSTAIGSESDVTDSRSLIKTQTLIPSVAQEISQQQPVSAVSSVAGPHVAAAALISQSIGQVQLVQSGCSSSQAQLKSLQNSVTPISSQGIPIQVIQGGQQLILKTATGTQLNLSQQQHQQQSSKVAQLLQAASPNFNRTLTPSQSPAPTGSPLVSRALTPNQSNTSIGIVNRSLTPSQLGQSASPAPNVSVLQIPSSVQSQPQHIQAQTTTGTTVPIQNLVQPQNLLSGQPVLPAQGQNIVHTQNTVIQNPNVVNVNVAHVLCNNSQQANQQGGMVSVYPNVQASTANPVTLQGTIIQTPQGKSIIIPSHQLTGQQINVAGLQNLQPVSLQQHVNVGQQVQASGTLLQTSQTVAGGTMQLPSQQQAQDKNTNLTAQPNISFLNFNPQGPFVIQRGSAGNQTSNIILRTIPSNIIQIQATTNNGQTSGVTSQVQSYPQISQAQLINTSQAQGSIPVQQVVNTIPAQQLKVIGQPGLQVSSQQGAVTMNIGGQNINIQQLPGQISSLQGMQLQGSGQVLVQAQPQQQNQSVPIHTAALKSSNAQAISTSCTQATLQTVQNTNSSSHRSGSNRVKTPPSRSGSSAKNSSALKLGTQMAGHRNQGSPQQLVQTFQNVQLPISQLPNLAAVSTPGLSTAHSTNVTTTVSQSLVQMPSQVSVANSLMGVQVSSSTVQTRPPSGTGIQVQTSGSQIISAAAQTPTMINATRLQTIQLNPQDQSLLNRVQNDIRILVAQKPLTAEQRKHLEQLAMLQKKLLSHGQQQFVASLSGQVGQPQIAQPPVAQSHLIQQAASNTLQLTPTVSQSGQMQGTVHLQQTTQSLSVISNSTSVAVSSIPASNSQTVPVLSTQTTANIVHSSSGTVQQIPSILNTQTGNKHVIGMMGSTTLIPVATNSNVSTNSLVHASTVHTIPTGKLPIPATPTAVPTQIKIGDKEVTVNMTLQQKEKLMAHLTKLTPEQQQLFLKQQSSLILKLEQQQQLQQQIQNQLLQQQRRLQQPQQRGQKQTSTDAKIPLTVQQLEKAVKLENGQSTGRVLKRPLPPEISKASMLHQQLSRDQAHGLKPDTKTPFKSKQDACCRLLRFHVFQDFAISDSALNKADNLFEQMAEDVLKKKQQMFEKYQHLLLEESMRDKPSAEMVMIERMLNQDLTAVIEEEKKIAAEDLDAFEPMPLKLLKTDKCAKVSSPECVIGQNVYKEEFESKENLCENAAALFSDRLSSEQKKESSLLHVYSKHSLPGSKDWKFLEKSHQSISPPPRSVKLVIRNDGVQFSSCLPVDKVKKSTSPKPPCIFSTQMKTLEPAVKLEQQAEFDYHHMSVKKEPGEEDAWKGSDIVVKQEQEGYSCQNYSKPCNNPINKSLFGENQDFAEPLVSSKLSAAGLHAASVTIKAETDFLEQPPPDDSTSFHGLDFTMDFILPENPASNGKQENSIRYDRNSGQFTLEGTHFSPKPLDHDSSATFSLEEYVSDDKDNLEHNHSTCPLQSNGMVVNNELQNAVDSIVNFESSDEVVRVSECNLSVRPDSRTHSVLASSDAVQSILSGPSLQHTREPAKPADCYSDPKLKQQTESAVNSILGLNQESSIHSDFSLDGQPDEFGAHHNCAVDQTDFFSTQNQTVDESSLQASADTEMQIEDDLDAAVQSILM